MRFEKSFDKLEAPHSTPREHGMARKVETGKQRTMRGPLYPAVRQIGGLVAPHKLYLTGGLAALLIGSSINLLFPEVVRRLLDPARFPQLVDHLTIIFCGLAGLFVIQGIAFYLRSRLFGLLGQRVYAVLREELFRAVQHQGISFFDRMRSGDLASRINSDAALIQDLVSIKISVILRYGAQVVIGTALMAYMSWRMTSAIVASVLCIVVVSVVFVRSLRAASRAYQGALAALSSFTTECFSGAKVVRALGAEATTTLSFSRMSAQVLSAGEKRVAISAAFSSGASLLLNVLLLGVLWYGLSLVLREELPLNDLAAFALYGAIVAVSFSFLVSAYSEVIQGIGGLDLVFELIKDGRATHATSVKEGSYFSPGPLAIEFKGVSFSYPQRPDTRVLDNLSLMIPAGKTVAVMGPSGAGKSSLIQLILSFYLPAEGEISVGNLPLKDLNSNELRTKIAWVPQEPLLFGFSIYENLVLGNPQANRGATLETLKRWGFLDFIDQLPEGVDTQLGEHGGSLSGGQRQRLAIARALLRGPSVLLLDEATSALDSELEEKILSVIHSELKGATVLVVSHRITSVRSADKIIVMSDGRIIEEGSHDELVRREGLYKLYTERQRVAA